MDNGNPFCLFAFLILVVVFACRSDATACQAQKSQVVNETHPSASNNWQASDDLHTPYIEDERSDVKKDTSLSPKLPMTDTEQWNSTTLTAFCPDISRLFIDCADEKGEAIGAFKNSSIYTAYCTVVLGLSCKPGKNFQTNHCPDFAVTYGCKCPTTTTSTTTATTTRIRRNTTTTRKKTTNPPSSSSMSHTNMTGLHSSTAYNSRTSTQQTTEISNSTESQTSSATESNSSNDSKEDGGLSTGVIAGIAAGSLLLLILIIVLVIRLWLYLKNKQNNKVAELPRPQQI